MLFLHYFSLQWVVTVWRAWDKLLSNSAKRGACKLFLVALMFNFVQGWLTALLAVQVNSIFQWSEKTQPVAEDVQLPAMRIWKDRCTCRSSPSSTNGSSIGHVALHRGQRLGVCFTCIKPYLQQHLDMNSLRKKHLCCLALGTGKMLQWNLLRWSPLGPDQLVAIQRWPAYKDCIENYLILYIVMHRHTV